MWGMFVLYTYCILTLYRIHYVDCICTKEVCKKVVIFGQITCPAKSNFPVHSSSLKGLSEIALGLSNQSPIIYGCSSKFLFLMNKLFTT